MNVYWLEQVESDVPATDEWLRVAERTRLSTMRVPKRRADWRLGRWTAKRAVASYWSRTGRGTDLANIEVASLPSGAPYVVPESGPADLSISLSHRAGHALCAVFSTGISVGCDIELVEPRSDSFVEDYFTADERELARSAPCDTRDQLVTVLWSAKESALKALYAGLTLETRGVVVNLAPFDPQAYFESVRAEEPLAPSDWLRLDVTCVTGTTLHGWYRCDRDFARTFVSNTTIAPPTQLAARRYQSEAEDQSASSTKSAFDWQCAGEEM